MVHFISKPTRGVDPDSEVKVAKALEALDDDWRVIYSVGWQGKRGRREGDGEADFVLVSKSSGVVILEVKGGGVELERGRWKSTDRYGEVHDIKDPFEQAAASKVTLHKWLRETQSIIAPTMHAVVFPDVSTPPNLGPAGQPDLVIDRAALTSMPDAINGVISHWKLPCRLTSRDVKMIEDALAPTVSVRRTLADDAYDAEHALVRLTDEQRRAFSGLRRARRAIVYGGPGTGKTLLASEKAAQLAEEGAETLLVCYNTLLAQALAASESLKNVKVMTFHALCLAAMKQAGLTRPSPISELWWEAEAPISLIEAAEKGGASFDAIVVDEGQDFAADWLVSVMATLRDPKDSPLYIFADADQTLWPRNWEPEPDWFPYELSINCRNTAPMSDVSAFGPTWGNCVTEDFRLIVVTERNADETEIHEPEGPG